MVHLTPLEAVPSEGLNVGYWVRWGDVKGLNLPQYKVAVVGPNAHGSSNSANTILLLGSRPKGSFSSGVLPVCRAQRSMFQHGQ